MSRFADNQHVPVVRFGKNDPKIEVTRRHLAAQEATGTVAAIGVAQEFQNVFAATRRQGLVITNFGYHASHRTKRLVPKPLTTPSLRIVTTVPVTSYLCVPVWHRYDRSFDHYVEVRIATSWARFVKNVDL
ncbi:MAG: hypothetical protein ACRDT6_08825 [Micromonosporaceae bacterium]